MERDELGDETRKPVWDQIIESHAPELGLLHSFSGACENEIVRKKRQACTKSKILKPFKKLGFKKIQKCIETKYNFSDTA